MKNKFCLIAFIGMGILVGTGKITILEISSEYVKGNFKFTTAPDDITHIVKTITNGASYIKRG